ncbi:hypothetical protein HPB48_019291 [Haemaphysalis longicornis]|uniref:Uncharacterized protein n=1 Tax=Haemaphysalis longicornis TaxID=44386 RepID=A0A9J6GPA3_HAELO|nr:hypothetical protein HPB48_019291 [Haemaphysalis longicornis]
MRDLVQATPARIPAVRMMGATKSALIIFEGTSVARYIYRNGRCRCYPHRPKGQLCTRCHTLGHREDVFPLPLTTRLCYVCFMDTNLTPTTTHGCVPKCPPCKGSHCQHFRQQLPATTDSKQTLSWPNKTKRIQALRTKHTSGHRSRSRSIVRQRPHPKEGKTYPCRHHHLPTQWSCP